MSKRRKRKKLRRKALLSIIIILLIASACIYFLLSKTIVISSSKRAYDTIKGYDYTIDKRDTTLMKDNFKLLKDVLSSETINYDKYAEYLSKLYIIDLYTINNKKSKHDVGSVEYVYKDYQESFKNKVSDTLYNYISEDIDLPEVESVEIQNLEAKEVSFNEKTYEGYIVVLNITYNEDLGYDKEAELTLIKEAGKLYVAKHLNEVSHE